MTTSYNTNNDDSNVIELNDISSLNNNSTNTNSSDLDNLQQHLIEEHASTQAKYIKSIIYGGLDGIVTTFSILAAGYGADLEILTILILGIANLFADAISMGYGDYLSTSAENEYILSERDKEKYEYLHNKEHEKEEMVNILKNEGMDEEDAINIINIYTSKEKYTDMFLNLMMKMELGLDVPDKDEQPWKNGLVTFTSFICFGSVPIWSYVIYHFGEYDNDSHAFIISACLSAITLFCLGSYHAYVTLQPIWIHSLRMTFNGILASSVAFFIGFGLEQLK